MAHTVLVEVNSVHVTLFSVAFFRGAVIVMVVSAILMLTVVMTLILELRVRMRQVICVGKNDLLSAADEFANLFIIMKT